MARGTRNDQYVVSMALDGVDTGIWDKWAGGDLDSDEVKYAAGAMASERSLGGRQITQPINLTRNFDLDRDPQYQSLFEARRGKGHVVVTKQPLDADGNPFGRPLVYTGTMKFAKFPEADSNSNAAGLIEVQVSPDARVSA